MTGQSTCQRHARRLKLVVGTSTAVYLTSWTVRPQRLNDMSLCQVLRVLRMLKVLRTIRLVRRARRLRLIVGALLRSIPHIVSSLLLLALFVFLFAGKASHLSTRARTRMCLRTFTHARMFTHTISTKYRDRTT